MPSYVSPKKNAAYVFYVGLVSQADTKLLQSGPTLAAGDAQVSVDGGAFANLATIPDVDPDASVAVKVSLSASEMNGDNIVVTFVDASGAQWCGLLVNIQTTARQVDDLAWPTTSGRSIDVLATGEVGLDFSNIFDATAAHTLSNITVPIVTTITDGVLIGDASSDAVIADAVWNALTASYGVANSYGALLESYIDAAISSRSSHSAADVWAVAVRALTDKADFALSAASRSAIADDVWDELLAGHATAGSAGKALSDVGSSADIADAVWDELLSGHAIAGSASIILQKTSFDLG